MTVGPAYKRREQSFKTDMRRTVISVGEVFAWAKLNGVDLTHVDVNINSDSGDEALKGAGLVSRSDLDARDNGTVLMSVPSDLILSREQVERYAAIDNHLKLVLDAAGIFGRVSARCVRSHVTSRKH